MDKDKVFDYLQQYYCLSISPILEQKINYLIDNSKWESDLLIDELIYNIFKKGKSFFKNRDFIDFIVLKAIQLKKKDINILIISNDKGQFAGSVNIAFDMKKMEFKDKNIHIYDTNSSKKLIEDAEKGEYLHDDLMSANMNDLDYFSKEPKNFKFNSNIIDLTNRINSSVKSIPMKDNKFDIVIFRENIKHFANDYFETIVNETYRVLKENGMLLVPENNIKFFMKSSFDYRVSEEKVFFIKNPELSNIVKDEITYENAIKEFKEKEYMKATMIVNLLLKNEKDNKKIIELYRLLFVIYTRQDDVARIAYLEKIIKADGISDTEIDFIIGSYYFSKMDNSLALGYFKNAIMENEFFIYAHYYIAIIYQRMGKISESKDCFQKCLEIINTDKIYNPEFIGDSLSPEMITFIAETELA